MDWVSYFSKYFKDDIWRHVCQDYLSESLVFTPTKSGVWWVRYQHAQKTGSCFRKGGRHMAGSKQGCVRWTTDKFKLLPDLGKIDDFNIFIWVSLLDQIAHKKIIRNYKKIMAEVCVGQPNWKLWRSNHRLVIVHLGYIGRSHHQAWFVHLVGLPLFSHLPLFQPLSIT